MSTNPREITIRKERFYPHPPEDVWTAITDPYAIAEWMEPNNHEAVVGHTFEFMTDPGRCGSLTECEVVEAERPHKLVWKWVHLPKKEGQPKHEPMFVSWTLTAKDGGTHLLLEHRGAQNISFVTRSMMRVGWGYMLKRLIPRVLGNVSGGAFTPGAIPLSKRCYKAEAVPEKYIR